jgi:hypothetical protein
LSALVPGPFLGAGLGEPGADRAFAVDLIDSTRCLIQAGHAFASLLADGAIADAVGRAEATLGMQFALWRRLP